MLAPYGKALLWGAELALEEINAAGGIDGRTVRLEKADNRSIGAESASAVLYLSTVKGADVRFDLPDGTVIEDDFIFGALSNSTSVGGILTLAPDRVDMADGLLEMLLVRAPKDLKELADCLVALQKQTYNCAAMTFLSTESVKVYASSHMDWTLDGEYQKGSTLVHIQNHRQALRVYAPETGAPGEPLP